MTETVEVIEQPVVIEVVEQTVTIEVVEGGATTAEVEGGATIVVEVEVAGEQGPPWTPNAPDIEDALGYVAADQDDLAAEVAARIAGDQALDTALDAETAARIAADTALTDAIDTKLDADDFNPADFDPAGSAAAAQAAAIAAAAAAQAFSIQRANHTGTQLAATISDFAAATRAVVLTGLSLASSAAIADTDTVLTAFGKLQAQNTAQDVSIAAKEPSIAVGTTAQFYRGDKAWSNALIGPLGIGAAPSAGRTLDITQNITGSTLSYVVMSNGTVQSDVTSGATYFRSGAKTAAAAFTLTSLLHFAAVQGTIGAGSTVTNQYGFNADSSLTGATNNYGFYSELAAASGRWNFYANGTASNYFAGRLGLGNNTLTAMGLRNSLGITGATTAYANYSNGTIASDVTTNAYYNHSAASTAAAAFTLTNLYHFAAVQGTIGAGSAVTTQYGFHVSSTLIGATTNYGFYGDIAAGTNRWNVFMTGTASNYMAGSLGIGSSTLTGYNLRVDKNVTGSVDSYGVRSLGAVQSDVTNSAHYYATSASTQATSFNCGSLYHYRSVQGTIGAGSTVSSQYGFYVDSSLTGATANYGFFGGIAAGTGRYNLYMNGSADNYMTGALGIGGVPDASSLLTLTSTTKGLLLSRMTTTQRDAIASPVDGLIVYNSTLGALDIRAASAWASLAYRNPKVQTATQPAANTLTVTVDTVDLATVTAANAAFTIASPTGTPVNGQFLDLRFKDNGTGRALTWNGIFRAIGVTLPTTTVANKTHYIRCQYNSADTKWDVYDVKQEA